MLDADVKQSIAESVLCWLATSDAEGQPNVSPKEVFMAYGDSEILIADIASPQSVRNLQVNAQVSVGFVHVLKEKGYQCKGMARYLKRGDLGFDARFEPIWAITGEAFPVKGIISVEVKAVKPIIAPSYFLLPEVSEAERIEKTRKSYQC